MVFGLKKVIISLKYQWSLFYLQYIILILKIEILIISIKLPKLIVKYLEILFFEYNIYKAKNQKKYNNSKRLDFKN